MSYSLSFSNSLLLLVFVYDKTKLGVFEYVPTSEISDKLSIPRPTLAKIVKALSSNGILEAKEGKNGGVKIKHKSNAFTLYDVFVAVEGDREIFPKVPEIKAIGGRPRCARKTVQSVIDRSFNGLKSDLSKTSFGVFIKNIDKAQEASSI